MLKAWPVDPDTRRPLPDKGVVLREKGNRILSAAFSPDGSQLAICSEQIELYDVNAGAFIGRFTGGTNHWASFLAWSPDGRTIVTSSILPQDFFLRAWDVETRSMKRALLDTAGLNEMFVFASPCGRYIASSTMQGHVLIRDASSLNVLRQMADHTSAVFGCAFSPDGSRLLSCSADGTVRVWNTDTGECLQVFSGFPIWNASCAFAPDGSALAVRDTWGDVRVWGTPSPDVKIIGGHTGDVVDVSISHQGKYIVSAGWDGKVVVRDAQTHATVREFTAMLAQFFTGEANADATRVYGGGSDGLRIFDGNTGAILAHTTKGEVLLDMHLLPGGKQLMALYYRQANILDAETGEKVAEFSRHGQLALAMSVTQDGSLVATSSTDGTVRIHAIATRELVQAFSADVGEAYSLAFSPDGKLLAVAGGGRQIRVFDSITGELRGELLGHEGIVFGLAWSADGKWLYSASQDRTVRLWDYTNLREFAVLRGHTETATRMVVTPQGTIITGSQDDTLRAWQVQAVMGQVPDIVAAIRSITGMNVPEKSFAALLDSNWPGERPDGGLRQRRRQASDTRRETSVRFQVQFEGYRYSDTERDGVKLRRYHPARSRDASGRPMGHAPGTLNYRAWLADNRPEKLAHLMESSAVITELTGEGQAQSLGLKAGDVLYAANGERLTDREALRAALEAAGDSPLRVTVRRFTRDAAGKPQPAADMEGLLYLDEAGRTRWDYTEFEVQLSPGRIGARIGEESMLPTPAR
jgi:WD40 repeat protein